MNKKRSTTFAFSLVEIALALGVISFAFTAIFGLLGASYNVAKSAQDDTMLVLMTNDIVSSLRCEYFYVAGNNTRQPVLPGTKDVANGATPAAGPPSSIYFDGCGKRLTDSTGADLTTGAALTAGAMFACTQIVTAAPPPGAVSTLSSTGSDGSSGSEQINLLYVTLTFQWPVNAAQPPNTRTIYTSVARFL